MILCLPVLLLFVEDLSLKKTGNASQIFRSFPCQVLSQHHNYHKSTTHTTTPRTEHWALGFLINFSSFLISLRSRGWLGWWWSRGGPRCNILKLSNRPAGSRKLLGDKKAAIICPYIQVSSVQQSLVSRYPPQLSASNLLAILSALSSEFRISSELGSLIQCYRYWGRIYIDIVVTFCYVIIWDDNNDCLPRTCHRSKVWPTGL